MTGLFRQGWARVLACTGVALTVAGCDVGSDYQGLAYAFSGSYAAKASGTPVLLKNQAWWESFNDPVLNALIEDGLAGNLDLQVARERVIEAQALVDTVPSPIAVSGTLQAKACNACARPISPPSAVTAALLDIFCGLNGATDRPRRTAARHKPATSMDFPTLEPVPWIMMALVIYASCFFGKPTPMLLLDQILAPQAFQRLRHSLQATKTPRPSGL